MEWDFPWYDSGGGGDDASAGVNACGESGTYFAGGATIVSGGVAT